MHDQELEQAPAAQVQAGLRVSQWSIAWTTVSSAIAVTIGVRSASVVLVAFGLTGLLDVAGSVALVVHFRHALRHETVSSRREDVAHRIVTVGLAVVGASTAVESTRRLVTSARGDTAEAGIALAAASVVVLSLLALRKRHAARRIPSKALLADAALTATGALLALVTVAGTAAAATWGWWWADPVAALLIACGAITVAAVSR